MVVIKRVKFESSESVPEAGPSYNTDVEVKRKIAQPTRSGSKFRSEENKVSNSNKLDQSQSCMHEIMRLAGFNYAL